MLRQRMRLHRPRTPIGAINLAARPPRTIPIAPGHCDVYKGSLHSQWACCKSHDGATITCNQIKLEYPKWHTIY